jgi:hypothetical protein
MPAIIAYDPHLSQRAREYLIQLEAYLIDMNPAATDIQDVLLYLNKLLTIHSTLGAALTEKVKATG